MILRFFIQVNFFFSTSKLSAIILIMCMRWHKPSIKILSLYYMYIPSYFCCLSFFILFSSFLSFITYNPTFFLSSTQTSNLYPRIQDLSIDSFIKEWIRATSLPWWIKEMQLLFFWFYFSLIFNKIKKFKKSVQRLLSQLFLIEDFCK